MTTKGDNKMWQNVTKRDKMSIKVTLKAGIVCLATFFSGRVHLLAADSSKVFDLARTVTFPPPPRASISRGYPDYRNDVRK